LKWQVSGHGLVGAVGAKQGCACPVRVTFTGGNPAVGCSLPAVFVCTATVRMFVASASNVLLAGDPCVLDPGASYPGTVKFPWVLWFIPGNLTRISAAQVRELESAGYGPEQQKRHQEFLKQELLDKYPDFKLDRPLRERVKRHRVVPLREGRRRMMGDSDA
jgi:hypothetical protein